MPAIARPAMNALDVGAAAHRMDPISKMAKLAMKRYLRLNLAKICPCSGCRSRHQLLFPVRRGRRARTIVAVDSSK